MTSTATVYVNVKDINDNPPVIEKSLYEVNVAEDVPIGNIIEFLHDLVNPTFFYHKTVMNFGRKE